MNQNAVTTPAKAQEKSRIPVVLQTVWKLFERIAHPILETFLPKPRYLEGEEVKQIIQMAQYRAEIPKLLGAFGTLVFVPALIGLGVTALYYSERERFIAAIFVIAALFFLFESAQEWLLYNQWKFIVTNKRFILITPHPERRGFADVIYLKGGKIQVLDTNFSKSPVWGLFQAILGTRDVMLSMSGYEFKETGAQVKGGLRFPDVRPEDIKRLEELIFG
ncbi:MAG TPA: hypothetical protein PKZ84_19015 [Anaerolineae bacterium]|nr:hypothetical protein [Anaerolineae bacterium]HQI86721.1 hypothetical protein [Anaerolineae bacterium]